MIVESKQSISPNRWLLILLIVSGLVIASNIDEEIINNLDFFQKMEIMEDDTVIENADKFIQENEDEAGENNNEK